MNMQSKQSSSGDKFDSLPYFCFLVVRLPTLTLRFNIDYESANTFRTHLLVGVIEMVVKRQMLDRMCGTQHRI